MEGFLLALLAHAVAVGYGPPAAKLLPGNCAHMSIENDHHVAVPVFLFGLHALLTLASSK